MRCPRLSRSVLLIGILIIAGHAAPSAGEDVAAPLDSRLRGNDARPPELLWQSGHTSPVNVVSFSPDGKLLASGSGSDFSLYEKNVVLLWDVATGTELRMFNFKDPVKLLYFSADGRRLAAKGSTAEDVKIWDIVSGEELPERTIDGEFVYRPVSSDGKIAADIDEHNIHIRDVASSKRIRTLASRTSDFQKVMFSPDSSVLASGGTRLSIRLWDLRSGTLRTLVGHTDYPIAADFSPDSRLFASGGRDLTVRIWDVASGREIKTLKGHAGLNVRYIKFSSDGKSLLSCDRAGLKLWDIASGRELVSVAGNYYDDESDYAVFNPRGNILAAYADQHIRLYSTETGKELRRFAGTGSLVFSPDGTRLAARMFGDLQVWDVASGERVASLTNPKPEGYPLLRFRQPVFSSDSRLLGVWEDDERDDDEHKAQLHLIEVATGKTLRSIKLDAVDCDTGGDIIFSDDNREITKINNTATTFAVATGEKVRSVELSRLNHELFQQQWSISPQYTLKAYGVYCPISANGKYYVDIGQNGELYLSDTKTWDWIALLGIDEKDWIVATEGGFFDGSPAAWKALYWRFNNDTFNYAPLEAFFNEYYYPGLLPDVLAGKRPRAPDGKDMSRVDRRQPKVEIACDHVPSGDDVDAVKDRAVTIKVTVEENTSPAVRRQHRASSGVRDVRVFRNGTLVKAWRGDVFALGADDGCETLSTDASSPRRICCTVKVPIVAGHNEFTAYAFNDANVKSTDAMLTLNGSPELARKPVLHILSIGLNEYDYKPLELRFAAADARAFASEVVKRQRELNNFAEVKLTLLVDGEATKQSILKAHTDLAKSVAPEDSVIVYFAGHGTAHENHFYLIPHDIGYADDRPDVDNDGLQELLRRSISDRELEQAFEQIDASQILFVLDACNSGQALEADERRCGPMNSKGLAQLAYEKGMYVLTASQSYQAAHEVSKLGHGLLTYVLVDEALKQSSADRDPADGRVDVCEMLNFATDRVPRMQLDEMQLASARGVDLSFSSNDSLLAPEMRSAQRPRAFYRNDRQIAPLVLSGTSAAPMSGELEALVSAWDMTGGEPPAVEVRPLSVALSERTIMDEPVPAKLRDEWQKKLKGLHENDGRSFRLVNDAKKAEWLVQIAAIERPDVVYLGPVAVDEKTSDELLRMSPGGDTATEWLGREIRRIAMLPEDIRTKPQMELAKRAFLGIFRKGPAEDLTADIVEELNTYYHTPNSSQAVIGMYGKAVRGKRMLGKLPRFEQRGVVQNLEGIRRMETVHRQGRGSGKDFISLFGSRQAWRVVDLGAQISGGREQEVSFEIVGVRLEQSDVINALNVDSEALNYFDYLGRQGEPACVVLENVWLTSYAAAQKTNVGVGVNAETVLSTDSAKARVQNERTSSTEFSSPVVRCYQMYEAKLNQGKVVELVNVEP